MIAFWTIGVKTVDANNNYVRVVKGWTTDLEAFSFHIPCDVNGNYNVDDLAIDLGYWNGQVNTAHYSATFLSWDKFNHDQWKRYWM